eukprot:202561-Lingulodinium_polyedra.AAC.1
MQRPKRCARTSRAPSAERRVSATSTASISCGPSPRDSRRSTRGSRRRSMSGQAARGGRPRGPARRPP